MSSGDECWLSEGSSIQGGIRHGEVITQRFMIIISQTVLCGDVPLRVSLLSEAVAQISNAV